MIGSGRPIRVLVAILGLDQHEAGAFAVVRLLRDAGMEVVYHGRFGVPQGIVDAAFEEGVDIIGLSCHSWEYRYYLDALLQQLEERDFHVPVVIGGSVLTPSDREEILEKGVAATFGPGSSSEEIVERVRDLAVRYRAD